MDREQQQQTTGARVRRMIRGTALWSLYASTLVFNWLMVRALANHLTVRETLLTQVGDRSQLALTRLPLLASVALCLVWIVGNVAILLLIIATRRRWRRLLWPRYVVPEDPPE